MDFKQVIETKDGAVEFTAEFDADEVKFLIGYAVTNLMLQGAIPFTTKELSTVQHPSEASH